MSNAGHDTSPPPAGDPATAPSVPALRAVVDRVPAQDKPTTPRGVRGHLLGALEADLIGPFRLSDGHGAEEVLKLSPSRWYLAGFLAPEQGRELKDPESAAELNAPDAAGGEDSDPGDPDPKQRKLFPASLGMSVLLPAAADEVTARVSFADYERLEVTVADEQGKPHAEVHWRRLARAPEPVTLALGDPNLADRLQAGIPLGSDSKLVLTGRMVSTAAPGLSKGTRALSLFIVNRRTPEALANRADLQFIFQVKLQVACPAGFVPRPNLTGLRADDWDARIADLQFRNVFEYAVGHGISVRVPESGAAEGAGVTTVETTWLPRHEVPRVTTRECDEVETRMATLGTLSQVDASNAGASNADASNADASNADASNADAIEAALGGLPTRYARWIADQKSAPLGDGPEADLRDKFRQELMHQADHACERIREGIELLKRDRDVLEAFQLANQAMADQATKRNPDMYRDRAPAWRLFQLAFVLLNLPAVADPKHRLRSDVELIFFPTGGGKTEAYLGVIAFTLLLRRMRGQDRPDGGLGVAVILRYPLRLLTLDQLERATTLMCALELARRKDPARLGKTRFSIGLWVGKSATDNHLKDVAKRIEDFRERRGSSPCPLTRCPWCLGPIEPGGLSLDDKRKPTRLITACMGRTCEFRARESPAGLPIVYVDEQVYTELPSFLLATVDKFAMLPWRAEAGALFGKVRAQKGDRFYGPAQLAASKRAVPAGATLLPEGLHPPELIVQDELHLISGPLGTMVGLYETAIEHLCTRTSDDGTSQRPKIIASTATVRRAREQIAALYGRLPHQTRMFPPPGIDDNETFFAQVEPEPDLRPGRLYGGVAARGRTMKATLLRAYVNLLTAAEWCFDREGDPTQAADHYMTVAGYFNALRELGGMRRLVEDEARTRALDAEGRVPVDHVGPHPLWRNRTLAMEPLELTSREKTTAITRNKARLSTPFVSQESPAADVLLASNMISVGVDIDRLGVMVVAGQPKSTAEYIQASSRVGRPGSAAGLVVTCFNLAKPRDRSHYEGFGVYHESFYRRVEASSVTPFSLPALDRGLVGVLVTMARFAHDDMTPPLGAGELAHHRAVLELAVTALVKKAGAGPGGLDEAEARQLSMRAQGVLDDWETAVRASRDQGEVRVYHQHERGKTKNATPLLRGALDRAPEQTEAGAPFAAPTSMRDVEPTVHLWIPRKRKEGAT